MDEPTREFFHEIREMAEEGKPPTQIAADRARFANKGVGNLLAHLRDFAGPREGDAATQAMQLHLYDELARLARAALRRDRDQAGFFANSLHSDHPDVPGSGMRKVWGSMVTATHATRDVAKRTLAGDPPARSVVWGTQRELCRSGNEFLSQLYGWMLLLAGVAGGAPPKTGYLKARLGVKLETLPGVLAASGHACPLWLGLVDVPLRNAIAHDDVELLRDRNVVRIGTKAGPEDRGLGDFELRNGEYASMVMPYTACCAAIGIEHADPVAMPAMIPDRLRDPTWPDAGAKEEFLRRMNGLA